MPEPHKTDQKKAAEVKKRNKTSSFLLNGKWISSYLKGKMGFQM